MSKDTADRLKSHNSGKVRPTKAFKPWIIVHTEMFESRIEARQREKYLKPVAGRKWRKNNLGM